MFGLAISSKWSAVVPLAGFALLVVVWDAGARRSLGVRNAFWRAAVVDGLPAFGYLVVVAVVVYVASWTGWLMHAHVYETALAHNNYGPYWGDYTQHRRARVLPVAVPGAAQPVALPPGRVGASTATAWSTPRTPTSRPRRAGWSCSGPWSSRPS